MHESLIGLFGRLILAMGVVFGLMVVAAKVAKNRGFAGAGGRKGGRATIEVLARQQFGKSASIAVIRAAGKALVLGVTDMSVTVLAEADPDALDIDLTGPEAQWTEPSGGDTRPSQPWKTLLEQLRERTIRR
jgi:flagellar protein FliO/FliZ